MKINTFAAFVMLACCAAFVQCEERRGPTPDPISVESSVPLTPPAVPTPAPPVDPKTDEQPKPSLVLAIDGPTEIEPGRMLTLRVSGITTTAAIDGPLPGVSWLMYPLTEDQRIERNGHAIHATWPGPCHVWFVASVNNPDPTAKPLTAMKLVKVGEPVVPPQPDVKPPGPKPAPIIGEAFTVLILEDRESNRDLPKPQRDALSSSDMLAYLDAKCAKVDGHPEWRKWDDNLKPENISEDEPWKARYQQAYDDSKGVRPWLYASNGKTAISIPFPATESAVMAELKKLGGE